jgi:hypothetical protein
MLAKVEISVWVNKRPLAEVCKVIRGKNYLLKFRILYAMAVTGKGPRPLSYERGWAKSAENLGACSLKRDLLYETTSILLDRPFKNSSGVTGCLSNYVHPFTAVT